MVRQSVKQVNGHGRHRGKSPCKTPRIHPSGGLDGRSHLPASTILQKKGNIANENQEIFQDVPRAYQGRS